MIGAIIAGIAGVAGLASGATNIGLGVKAQQEAKKQFKKTSEGEKAALGIQRMKTADIAGLGGLTAGQYGRALMQDDAYAMQVQGLVNKIEQQSRFGDAFRKEAFYKLALSDIKQFTQKTAMNIQDMDSEAIVRNAQISIEASDRLRKSESEIIARENELKRQELEMEAKIASNIGATIESLAKITGASVKYYDYQKKLNAFKNVHKSTGIAGALSTPQADKVFGQSKHLESSAYNEDYNYTGRSTPSNESFENRANIHAMAEPVVDSLETEGRLIERTEWAYGGLMASKNIDQMNYFIDTYFGLFN